VGAIRDSSATVRAAVARVESRSREIGRILEVIEEIARQTNLLEVQQAINALPTQANVAVYDRQ
jgi:methyl-accepting chemotaxis protein